MLYSWMHEVHSELVTFLLIIALIWSRSADCFAGEQ